MFVILLCLPTKAETSSIRVLSGAWKLVTRWLITLNLYEFGVIMRDVCPQIVSLSSMPSIRALKAETGEMLGSATDKPIQSNCSNLSLFTSSLFGRPRMRFTPSQKRLSEGIGEAQGQRLVYEIGMQNYQNGLATSSSHCLCPKSMG